MDYPLGVDVGTTYTAAAIWRDGRVESVPLGNRANAVPSVLFVRDDGTLLVGEPAVLRGVAEPERQAREFKRRMGDEVPLLVGGEAFTAPELTARVLRWTVDRVTELQGGAPGHVVLTHPAEWGSFRQGLLTEAAMAAGLPDVGLLPEPVAAATWYAAQERVEPDSLVGVYDFGGGTFDAAVVRKTGTGLELFGEAGGDDTIGGIDFDHALLRHVASVAGVDLTTFDRSDPAAATTLGQLFNAVVEAKEALSADTEAVVPVVLPGVTAQVLVTRAEFEDLVRPAVRETVSVFAQVVRRSGVDPAALRTVLLVGGSSRIPLVARMLSEELGVPVALDAHPKHTVSLGAVIAAAPRGAGVGTFPIPRPATWTATGSQSPEGSGSGRPTAMLPVPGATDELPVVSGTRFLPQPGATEMVPIGTPDGGPGGGAVGGVGGPVGGAGGPIGGAGGPAGIAGGPAGGVVGGAVGSLIGTPAVARPVDLAASAITAAVDVPVVVDSVPVINLDMRPQPKTVVRTRDPAGAAVPAGGPSKLKPILGLVAVVATVAVVVGVAVSMKHKSSDGAPTGPATSASAPGAPTVATGTLRLAGGPVGAADPKQSPDTMRAVAALPSGDLVAVGVTLDQAPRAWVRRGAAWSVAAAPPADQFATPQDVAAAASGAVAVGWTGSGAHRRAAVWTTRDGASWKLLDPAGDFAAGSGVTELTALTVTADHRLLAIGQDHKPDPADGDAAVFSSPDGVTWTRVPATGLSGPGPQTVRRLTRTTDGHLLAVGSALSGAHQAPAMWTSADGVAWQSSAIVPDDASAALQAVAQQPDGSLLTCGTTGSPDTAAVACWTQRDPQQGWQPLTVAVAAPANAPAVYLYDLVRTPAGLIAVGAGRNTSAVGAVGWTVTQEP